MTPEQEAKARRAWSACYVNLPGQGRCGECAGDFLAAALATVDQLRGIVMGYQRDGNTELDNQAAALRAEVTRLREERLRVCHCDRCEVAKLDRLDAARERTP